MSPVFGHGHLRLYLLSLLNESPRHGYELIQSLGERFGGTYVPSAGTIYPRLAKLEEEGLVTKSSDGRKTVYEITDAGRAELASRADELSGIEDELSDSVRRLANEVRTSVNSAMKSLRADLASAAQDARDEAKASARAAKDTVTTVRVESRVQLQSAEVVLAEFRHQMRAELRRQVTGQELSAETIEVLRSGLEDVRKAVIDSLTVSRN